MKNELLDIIRRYGKLAVAYSGGVDSSVLLKASCEALSPVNVIALTLVTPLNPSQEVQGQEAFAASLGVRQVFIDIDPLIVSEIRANGPKRCYYCKKYMFSAMLKAAKEQDFSVLADGTNADDTQGYRPGIGAARELGVVSPLKKAGLTKAGIRQLAEEMGLPQKSKPSSPCLATRIPYGVKLDEKMLRQVDEAEEMIRAYGILVCRVRHHGDIARIEVSEADREKLMQIPELIDKIKTLGFHFVCLDLEGYRSGAFDVFIEESEK